MYSDFADVTQGSWYETAVGWAAQNGIVYGYEGGFFEPDNNVTRQDLAVILNNYAAFTGKQLPPVRDYADFNDEDDITVYAKEAIERFYRTRIISGRPGNNFAPKDVATRAEFAAMLMNFLDVAEQGNGDYNDDDLNDEEPLDTEDLEIEEN